MYGLWLYVRGVENLVLVMVMVFGQKGGGGGCRKC